VEKNATVLMNTDRWRRIEALYHEAYARPASERATFLDEVCGGDGPLRREVESLLAQAVSTDGVLDRPVLAVTPPTRTTIVAMGTRLGSYEIVGALGAGGMGEVYRARDTTLQRDVAIKVLPAAFSHDLERLASLAREARLLAALNHPHIATIHGLEEADGIRALVMELVDGPTLADKLALAGQRGVPAGFPLADVLTIAGQIAEALEAAHEKGVIHRDLKPANIKLGRDGRVKVLDFGLAKACAIDGTGSDRSPLAAMTATVLRVGAIVGTAAYMSPEQARGQAIDKRTDIWAFGCVLYEMLTGRAVFAGATLSDTLAMVLERQPVWGALPAHTPLEIRHLLRRCLEKDPKRRLHDIADARIEIDDLQRGTRQDGPSAQTPDGSRRPLAWASALALVALMTGGIGGWALRPVATAHEARLEINTPPTRDPLLAISPDGLKVVFAGRSTGQSQLWLRSLDSEVARPLPGTERGYAPFWSPDGRSIGFGADTRLMRMDIDDGSLLTLASDLAVFLGGTWNRDGTVVFASNPNGPMFRISAEGGDPVAVTRVVSPQRGHAFPQFLPDGRHFLFFVTGSPNTRGVYVGHLDAWDTKRVFDADAPAVYAATGHLLFIRENTLLAQRFDPDRLELTGQPYAIAERVTTGTRLSASAAGTIAYRTSAANSEQRQLVWVDRSGRELDKAVYRDTASLGPSLSPDGRRVAVFRLDQGNMDIWSYETSRRAWDRLTFDPGDDIFPLWSSDGTSIVFGSARHTDIVNLYRKFLSAPHEREELLLATPQPKFPTDWSADARFVVYDSLDPKRGYDIWALPLNGQPFEVLRTDFNERLAQFSPDGTWIAYQSDKTGRYEIYVRPFPGPGDDQRISIDGGAQVRWNSNGTELFYIAADDRLMAVPIRIISNGKAFASETPRGLFDTIVGSTAINANRHQYVVSPDGQSFVMNTVVGDTSASPITVILNWKPHE
jgi:serine/threonine protein kinase/Tol biopolymer transport system component